MNTSNSHGSWVNQNPTPPPDYSQLQQQLQFERLISGIAARFVNLPPPEIEAAIQDSLRQIGDFFGVEQVSMDDLLSDNSLKEISPAQLTPEIADRLKFIGHVLANALQRRRNEESLQFKAKLLNAVGQAVIATTPEGIIIYWNQAAERLYGWSAAEAMDKNIVDVTPASTSVAQAHEIMHRMQTGQSWSGEFWVQSRAGDEFPVLVTDVPVHDETGQLVCVIGVSQNVSQQKQTERKLQYRVAFDALVSEISTDLILLEADDIDHGIETALEKIAKFVGAEAGYVFLMAPDKKTYWLEYLWQMEGGVMDKTQLFNLDINDMPYFARHRLQKLPVVVSSPDDLPSEATAERQLYAQVGYKSALEVPMLWEDDVIGFVGLYCLSRRHTWNSDEVQLLTIVGQMITNAIKRKHSDQKLRQELNFHNAIIHNAASGLSVCHEISVFPFLRFTEWNQKMFDITGYTLDEINRLGWYQTVFANPGEQERAKARITSMQHGDDLQAEVWRITRPDGQERLVSVSTAGFHSVDGTEHILALVQDITAQNQLAQEKQALEAQLRRSQRLDTIGTLAGGIAHDFNNLLMPIIGFAELAELRLPAGHPVNHYLQQIGDAANRAKDLVQQILTFSRQLEEERQPVQIAPIIEEAVRLLRPTLPTTISIRQRVAANCDSVLGEPAQLHQIIMNLCTNAFQAMQKTGGSLTISLAQISQKEAAGYLQPKLTAQSHIKLTVSDTGEGMDAYTRDRIFEPFFTTRKVGQGTGLGMSVVHGIVKNYKGAVHINSEPGQGTEVSIFLPAVPPLLEQQNSVHRPPQTGSGSVTILLVDDDETVAEVTREMLSQLGYRVKKAIVFKKKNLKLQANQSVRQLQCLKSGSTCPSGS